MSRGLETFADHTSPPVDPVVPNLSFEKKPEGKVPCEMRLRLDTSGRVLPLYISPKSNSAGRWTGMAAPPTDFGYWPESKMNSGVTS